MQTIIKTYTIYGAANYQREVTCTAAQAIQKAANHCYVTPLMHHRLTVDLVQFGTCSYSYGFDCVTITETTKG